jgi:hypothetical protein
MFIGTDRTFEFEVVDQAADTAYNAATWTIGWMLKRKLSHADAQASITKATGSGVTVTGAFNADPDVNEQRVEVAIADTDTDALTAGTYRHELKRRDDGLEYVLAYGELVLKRGVHHA